MHREEAPDAEWVAHLAGVPLRTAERAIERAAAEERLYRHLDRAHRRYRRPNYVEIDAPLELYALTRLMRPRRIVEVGVSSGVSTAYLLAALARNRRGRLHSVDRPKVAPTAVRSERPPSASWSLPEGEASGWAVPRGLRGRWDLRLGDKADLLPVLAEELPSIDLFVYDVPHRDAESWGEFQRLDRSLRPGAVAIVDHGSGGDLCSALARWGRRRRARPFHRRGSGLYAIRLGPRSRP